MAAPAVSENTSGPAVAGAGAALGKASVAVWDMDIEDRYIDIWGTEFQRIGQGNFKKHHWENVMADLNATLKEGQLPFTVQQGKAKIDTLKKRYNNEMQKKSGTGSVNSGWVHFEKLGGYIRTLPKVSGIPGAVDSDTARVPSPPVRRNEPERMQDAAAYAQPGFDWRSGEVDPEAAHAGTPIGGSDSTREDESTSPLRSSTLNAEGGAAKRKSISETEGGEDDECKAVTPPPERYKKLPGTNGQLNSRKGRNRKLFKASPGGNALAKSLDAYTKSQADFMVKAFELEEKLEKNRASNALEIAKLKIEAQDKAHAQKEASNLAILKLKLDTQVELEKLRNMVREKQA